MYTTGQKGLLTGCIHNRTNRSNSQAPVQTQLPVFPHAAVVDRLLFRDTLPPFFFPDLFSLISARAAAGDFFIRGPFADPDLEMDPADNAGACLSDQRYNPSWQAGQ